MPNSLDLPLTSSCEAKIVSNDSSGQSYKCSVIIGYDGAIITGNFPVNIMLLSQIASVVAASIRFTNGL